jgi:hypothetical protein
MEICNETKRSYENYTLLQCFFFFETLNVWNCFLNSIVEGKYESNFLLVMNKWGLVESLV